jgi:hypothetical protein
MSPLWGAKRTWIKNTTRVGWKCRSDRISHLEVFRKLNENTPTRNSYFSKQFSEGIWRVDALIIAVDIKPLKNDRFSEFDLQSRDLMLLDTLTITAALTSRRCSLKPGALRLGSAARRRHTKGDPRRDRR